MITKGKERVSVTEIERDRKGSLCAVTKSILYLSYSMSNKNSHYFNICVTANHNYI